MNMSKHYRISNSANFRMGYSERVYRWNQCTGTGLLQSDTWACFGKNGKRGKACAGCFSNPFGGHDDNHELDSTVRLTVK